MLGLCPHTPVLGLYPKGHAASQGTFGELCLENLRNLRHVTQVLAYLPDTREM